MTKVPERIWIRPGSAEYSTMPLNYDNDDVEYIRAANTPPLADAGLIDKNVSATAKEIADEFIDFFSKRDYPDIRRVRGTLSSIAFDAITRLQSTAVPTAVPTVSQAVEVVRALTRPPSRRFLVQFVDHIQGTDCAEWECKVCKARWASGGNLECPNGDNEAEAKVTEADSVYNLAIEHAVSALQSIPSAPPGGEQMREALAVVTGVRNEYEAEQKATEDYEYGASLGCAIEALDRSIERLQGKLRRCDYRRADCVNDGVVVDGVWRCKNHLNPTSVPVSGEE